MQAFTHENIDPHEERLVRVFSILALIAALLTIPALVLAFSEPSGMWGTLSVVLNWGIWLAFLGESAFYIGASGFWPYVRRNKLDVVVLVLTVPFLPAALRGLWVLRLLRLIDTVPGLLGRRLRVDLLYYAMVLTFFAAYGGGMAFAHYEGVSMFDGIYWASTTLTSVGYGDISPETVPGKIVAILVQWSGAGVLALLVGEVVGIAKRKVEEE